MRTIVDSIINHTVSLVVLLVIVSFVLYGGSTQAQNDSTRNTITINAGASMAGLIVKALNYGDSISADAHLAIQANYDYCLKKWFSLGLASSYQQYRLTYSNTEVLRDKYNILDGSVSSTLTRANLAARVLFHYGNSGRVDMYSGARIGVTKWSLEADALEPFHVAKIKYMMFAPQLVLFGFRGYFTEHFGANTELCIGAPHYISAGLNCRF